MALKYVGVDDECFQAIWTKAPAKQKQFEGGIASVYMPEIAAIVVLRPDLSLSLSLSKLDTWTGIQNELIRSIKSA